MRVDVPPGQSDSRLRRHLKLGSAVALVVGEVIAVGVFLAPAAMMRELRAPLLVILVWLAMGVMAACGAVSYAELAGRFPQAGGAYIYLREAYGPAAAFLYGWMSLLVMDPGLTAALALGLGDQAAHLTALSPAQVKLVSLLSILLLAGANIAGARPGAAMARYLALLKVALLLFLIGWGFGFGSGQWPRILHLQTDSASGNGLAAGLAAAFVLAFFAFGGWWDLSKLAEEVIDPGKTIWRALILGIATVTAVYILITCVFIYLVPADRIVSDTAFAAQVGYRLFGTAGERIIAGVVMISVLGSLAGIIMAAPRVYLAMSRDGLFLRSVAQLAPSGSPVAAILVQALLACVMVAWTTFTQVVGYFVFVTVIFLGLTVVALFRFRRRDKPKASYRAWGYPFTPALFLLMVAILLALLFVADPWRSLAGCGVVLTGWPIYVITGRNRSDAEVGPAVHQTSTGDAGKDQIYDLDSDHPAV